MQSDLICATLVNKYFESNSTKKLSCEFRGKVDGNSYSFAYCFAKFLITWLKSVLCFNTHQVNEAETIYMISDVPSLWLKFNNNYNKSLLVLLFIF